MDGTKKGDCSFSHYQIIEDFHLKTDESIYNLNMKVKKS